MKKKRNSGLRFAVGSWAEYRSSIWKLVIGSDDSVYVCSRTAAGESKLSVHPSGLTYYGFTQESGIRFDGRRGVQSWKRPTAPESGWTRVAAVTVPNVNTEGVYRHAKDEYGLVIDWSPLPPPSFAVEFGIYVQGRNSKHPATAADLPFPSRCVKSFRLTCQDLVHVYSYRIELTEYERSNLTEFARGLRIEAPGDPGEVQASACVLKTFASGAPRIVDIPLGRENVVFPHDAPAMGPGRSHRMIRYLGRPVSLPLVW